MNIYLKKVKQGWDNNYRTKKKNNHLNCKKYRIKSKKKKVKEVYQLKKD